MKKMNQFILLTKPKPFTRESELKPESEEFFIVEPLPMVYSSRKWLREKDPDKQEIFSLENLKLAS
jgi:hypothetical protein